MLRLISFLSLLLLMPLQLLAIDPIGIDRIQERVKGLEAAVGENVAQRNLKLGYYRDAVKLLQSAEESNARAEEFKQAITDAPKEAKRVRSQADKLARQFAKSVAPDLSKRSIVRLEQQIAQEKTKVSSLSGELAELTQALGVLQSRPDASREALVLASSRMEAIEDQLRKPATAGEVPEVAEARHVALEARRRSLAAEIKMLKLERLSHEQRLELLKAKSALLEQQLNIARAAEQVAQEEVNRRLAREAEKAEKLTAWAAERAEGMHPLLQSAAETNSVLSQRLTELGKANEVATERLKKNRAQLQQIDRNYQRVLQQLEISAVDKLVGEFMRSQRSKLPEPAYYEKRKARRARELAEVRLAQFRVQQQQTDLADEKQAAAAILSTAEKELVGLSEVERQRIKKQLIGLLKDRKGLLSKLDNVYSQNAKLLGDIVLQQQGLIAKVQKYRELLDENLLWIANAEPLGWSWFTHFRQPLSELLSVENWLVAAVALGRLLFGHPLPSVVIVALIALLLGMRGWMRRKLADFAKGVGKVRQDHFSHTLMALVITLLLPLPWALLLCYSGWLLQMGDATGFSRAVGFGLSAGAEMFFILGFFRALYVKDGLAESHFRWQTQPRMVLSKNLSWLMPVFVLLTALVAMTEAAPSILYRDNLGRLTFIIGSLLILLFAWRVLRPDAGVLGRRSSEGPGGWRWHIRYLWYPLSLAMPLLLIALAAEGHYYTSLRLAGLIFYPILVVILAFLFYLLAVRWLLVAQRRLALKRALAKRQADQEVRAAREAAGQAGEVAPESLEMPEIEIQTINEQTRRLLRLLFTLLALIGLWWIWSPVAPALSVLDEFVLWERTLPGAEGGRLLPITIVDFGLALLVLLVTFVAQRNLPGLLEIAVLQPLALEPGNRYAVASISRYLIITSGVATAIGLIGVGWGDLQWLVAAVGVGLGFGLKEIFANFVSGLIILFERPIRVGDTVTIGEVSGTVSRIQIRATTIIDWDNKELIIPNQTLVVEPLINWTLSDQITRIIFMLGIAYGSDTEKAHQIMMETITANPLVLEEPNPTVFFIGFGDSSLDFEVRVFVKERIQRMPLTHELHMALEKALRENGIEIPFPQRDLHLRGINLPLGTE